MNDPDPGNAHASLVALGHALTRLREALSRDPKRDTLVLDATIQRFEFCTELTWKCLKRLLEAEGEQATTPKQSLQRAYAVEWIHDEALWLSMLQDRNLTSHTYKELLAQEIYTRIPSYCAAMERLHAFLTARHGARTA